MKKQKIFITITHCQRQGDSGWEVLEKCEFVNSLKNRHYVQSTVILDVINKTVLKDRVGNGTYDAYYLHVRNTYGAQMRELEKEFDLYVPEEAKEEDALSASLSAGITELDVSDLQDISNQIITTEIESPDEAESEEKTKGDVS